MRTAVAALSLLAVAVCAGLLAGCSGLRVAKPEPGGRNEGLAVTGPTLGVRGVHPDQCFAGARQLFWGADLVDEGSDSVVRFVIDPVDGPLVRLFRGSDPYGPSIVLRRADCRVFKFDFQPTGSWINGINLVRIALTLSCKNAAGDAVVGQVAAGECG